MFNSYTTSVNLVSRSIDQVSWQVEAKKLIKHKQHVCRICPIAGPLPGMPCRQCLNRHLFSPVWATSAENYAPRNDRQPVRLLFDKPHRILTHAQNQVVQSFSQALWQYVTLVQLLSTSHIGCNPCVARTIRTSPHPLAKVATTSSSNTMTGRCPYTTTILFQLVPPGTVLQAPLRHSQQCIYTQL